MVGCGGTSEPSQAQPLLWAGCHPLDQAARSPILPGLEHLQGWGSRSFSGQPAPVPTSPRLLGWVPRGCWAGRMSGKQAGRMAPCHALGPFFPSLLAFGPFSRCSFFSSCLGMHILELWRESAIACICEFLQRKDKVRAAVSTHCGNSPGSSPGRYPAGIAPRPTMLGVLLAVDLTFMPPLVPSVTTRMCKRKSNS